MATVSAKAKMEKQEVLDQLTAIKINLVRGYVVCTLMESGNGQLIYNNWERSL